MFKFEYQKPCRFLMRLLLLLSCGVFSPDTWAQDRSFGCADYREQGYRGGAPIFLHINRAGWSGRPDFQYPDLRRSMMSCALTSFQNSEFALHQANEELFGLQALLGAEHLRNSDLTVDGAAAVIFRTISWNGLDAGMERVRQQVRRVESALNVIPCAEMRQALMRKFIETRDGFFEAISCVRGSPRERCLGMDYAGNMVNLVMFGEMFFGERCHAHERAQSQTAYPRVGYPFPHDYHQERYDLETISRQISGGMDSNASAR